MIVSKDLEALANEFDDHEQPIHIKVGLRAFQLGLLEGAMPPNHHFVYSDCAINWGCPAQCFGCGLSCVYINVPKSRNTSIFVTTREDGQVSQRTFHDVDSAVKYILSRILFHRDLNLHKLREEL
jgi:hypothetical protein